MSEGRGTIVHLSDVLPGAGYDNIADSLEGIAKILRRPNEQDRAAWRLADAAGLLRELMLADECGEVIGVTHPSGRGFMLPERRES